MTTKADYFRASATLAAAAVAASLLVLVGMKPAEAAFPGGNGRIAFTYSLVNYLGDLEADIYTVNLDGTGQTNLTTNSTVDYEPAYAPDGEKIAFVSERDGNAEIYTMNKDGSGQTRLTNNAAADSQPAYAPNGTRIAFTSNRDGNNELYVANADGSGTPTRLTNNAASDSGPALSPDGSKIAFTSDRDGNREIYVMNADGSGTPTRLTNNPASDRAPSYAPDGSKVAFMSDRDDFVGDTATNDEIYVTNSDGSGTPTRLTNDTQDSQSDDSEPAFSPDGTKIAFSSYPICTSFCGATVWGPTISVMNATDGSGRTSLGDTEFGYSPDWGVGSYTPPPDTTPPETSITSGPSGPTNDNTPTFEFGSTEAGSTFECRLIRQGNAAGAFESCTTPKTYAAQSDGTYVFEVRAKDSAGNQDASPAQRSFKVDTAAPAGSVVINNNATRTKTRTVTLTLSATDPSPGSGVTSMRISNSQSGLLAAAWEPYAATRSWTLTAGFGTKTVYVQYKDGAGNVSAVARDTIAYR